jgi:hypothetical protein
MTSTRSGSTPSGQLLLRDFHRPHLAGCGRTLVAVMENFQQPGGSIEGARGAAAVYSGVGGDRLIKFMERWPSGLRLQP